MLEIPAVWLVIVKFAALLTSGIAVYDDKIMVRCSEWTSFHTIVAERSKIVKFDLEQNLLQRLSKRCAVNIWFEGEEHKRYRIKAMSVTDVYRITKLLGYQTSACLKTRNDRT